MFSVSLARFHWGLASKCKPFFGIHWPCRKRQPVNSFRLFQLILQKICWSIAVNHPKPDQNKKRNRELAVTTTWLGASRIPLLTIFYHHRSPNSNMPRISNHRSQPGQQSLSLFFWYWVDAQLFLVRFKKRPGFQLWISWLCWLIREVGSYVGCAVYNWKILKVSLVIVSPSHW